MKKVLASVLIPAGFLILSFTSCKKTHCYECITERYYLALPENTIEHIDRASKVHCGQTEESIREIEIEGTHYTTFMRGGKVIQEHTVTNCN